MFCDEQIKEVIFGYPVTALGMSAHMHSWKEPLEWYTQSDAKERLILLTDSNAIILDHSGAEVIPHSALQKKNGEFFEAGIVNYDPDEGPVESFESTLFVGQKLNSVVPEDGCFLLEFDDFKMKIIVEDPAAEVAHSHPGEEDRVYGLDRHIKRRCGCAGAPHVYIGNVDGFTVKCSGCGAGTYLKMSAIEAIDEWNKGILVR